MMISTASSAHLPTSAARHSGVLALEPPRHSKLPVAILVPGKHLIGADSACHIQIPLDGIHRHHVMVLVGEQKILLKALDPRTWVNDNVVTETSLRTGDRLSIGPITFRVRLATAEELRSLTLPAVEKQTPAQIPNRQPEPASVSEPQSSDATPIQELPAEIPATQRVEPEPIVAPAEETSLTERATELPGLTESLEIQALAPVILGQVDQIAPVLELAPVEFDAPSQLPEKTTEPETSLIQDDREQFCESDSGASAKPERLGQPSASTTAHPTTTTLEVSVPESEPIRVDADYELRLKLVEETRRELADEFARQTVVWHEREAAHRRSVEELNQQLEMIATQRTDLQIQSDVLAGERAELQRLQNDFDRAAQRDAIERRAARAETERLQAECEAYETDQRKQVVTLQEQRIALQDREIRLASERKTVSAAEEELFAFRKQLEQERTQFAADRSAESVRREQEIRDHAAAQQRLSEQSAATQQLRFELQAEQLELENRLADLQQEQDQVAAARIELNGLRDELTQAKIKFEHEFEQKLADARLSPPASDEGVVGYLQLELESRRLTSRSGSGDFATDPTSNPIYENPRRTVPSSSPVPPPIPVTDWNRPGFHQPSVIGTSDHPLSAHRLDSGSAISISAGNSSLHNTTSLGSPTFSRSSLMSVGDQTSISQVESEFSAVNAAMAVREAPSVSQTLLEVNQQFGLPMQFRAEDFIAQLTSPGTTQSDELGTEQSRLKPHIDLLPPGEMPASSAPLPLIREKDNSLSSLRAQLAQMFELPKSPPSTRSENQFGEESIQVNTEFQSGEALSEPRSSEWHRLGGSVDTSPPHEFSQPTDDSEFLNERQVVAPFGLSGYTFIADDSPSGIPSAVIASAVSSPDRETSSAINFGLSQATNAPSTSRAEPEAELTGEDAWTRRLRELSQLTTAESPPAPAATKPIEEPEPSNEEDEEYSVEAQLARLLGRPQRTDTRSADTPMSSQAYEPPKGIIGRDLAEAISSESAADRSHLTAEPKHRQNKNAVLQEVQSFRAVAQMSARLALATHSWNNLRSEIYFKGVLAAVSAAATAWFAATWFYGTEPEGWKALVCTAATLICLERLFHSSSKIRIWRKKNEKQPAVVKTTAASSVDAETDV